MAPKHLKTQDYLQLVDLVVVKDNELKQLLKLASEQEKIDEKINNLKAQVGKYDQEINQLHKQLKEAEQILSTAIFQAKQKLATISKANDRPIGSEELIKYAYRISASHAISAPLTWQQGDLRRPYPTDIEMRLGFLGKTDLNVNGHSLQTQNSVNDVNRSAGEIPASAQNQFAWFPTGELHMMSGHQSISLETNRTHKDASQDDASSDSSSSSSSDSQ
jgi:mediator of RNA polymerase II transcription subunit 4